MVTLSHGPVGADPWHKEKRLKDGKRKTMDRS